MPTKIQIPIRLASGFSSTMAEVFKVKHLRLGVHRSIGKVGWTATHIGTGIAVSTGATSKADAVYAATSVSLASLKEFDKLISEAPTPPELSTLPIWEEAQVAKRKTVAGTPAIDELVQAIVTRVALPLSELELAAIKQALHGRSLRLKARAPSDSMAAGAWYGLQPNFYKCRVGAILALSDEGRVLYDKLVLYKWPKELDADMDALVKLGAW